MTITERWLSAANTSCEFSRGGRNNPSAEFTSRWPRWDQQDAQVPGGGVRTSHVIF